MNIEGLTLQEVGEKIKNYLPLFLKDDFYFQESYQFEFNEIRGSIPKRYHKYFKNIDSVSVASGIVETEGRNGKLKNYYHTIILVSNENYTKALLLLLQRTSRRRDKIDTVILKNFLEG